jgi:hypothetical protein
MLAMVALVLNGKDVDAQITEDGLIGYWSFDSDAIEGETVKDIWGEHDGTAFGGLELVNGKVSKALKFDGVDDYVEIPHSEQFTISGKTITIEAWIWVESFPGKYGMIFGKRGDEYEVGINLDGEPVWFFLGDNSLGSAGKKLSEKRWWHVAWIWDESSGQSQIYMDGQEVGDYVTGDKSPDTTAPVTIGRDPGTTDASKYHFNGIIDEVRFYNRALTEAEVQKNLIAQGLAVAREVKKLAIAWGKLKSF